MSKRLLAIACLLGFWAVGVCAQIEERTVIDSERVIGVYDAEPWMMDYDGLGMRTGPARKVARDTAYFLLRPEAIKGVGAVHLQHFVIEGNNMYSDPTEELLAFERDEVRQGREPFFITATYEGRKRPVLLKWDLPGGLCEENNSCNWIEQAINIGDDRYIKFWVKNHVRRRLSLHSMQNWLIKIDNSMYRYKWYRVLDDDGNPQKAQWDEPFPQNDDEFADAAAFAFRRIKELAPDLILMDNQAPTPLSDMSRYGEVFGPLDGHSIEAFLDGPFRSGTNPEGFWIYIQRTRPPDGPIAYKLQWPGDRDSQTSHEVQQKFLLYLIACGPNAFFGVRVEPNKMEPNLQWYAGLKNALGSPVEPPQSALEPGGGPGYRLYWRRCQGGIPYLNLSGVAKTIYLPEDGLYYDAQGNPTTVLALDHQVAGYVTFEPGERVARPRIDPRRPGLVTGPLTITLETEPFSSGTRIVYTLDGSEPDEGSTVYRLPFKIYESCVVKAKAFDAVHPFLRLPSCTNFATYRLTDQEPTVEFHHVSDNGSEFMEHDYPVVSLSHVSAHPVTITYYPLERRARQWLGGTARPWEDYELEPGTLTIRPGEQHRYFYVHIVNDAEAEPDETLMISISDPVNATLGENTIYTYTIEDNDHEPPVPPIPPIIVKEDFETGDFSMFDWGFSGDADWVITSGEKNSGTYSAQAGSISDNESSTLRVELDCISGDISFYCKVYSESDFDYLKFYINGVKQDEWSGEQDWTKVSFPVKAGIRTFEWTYSKDGSIAEGDDTAWIDDIVFPVHVQEPTTPPPPPPTPTSNLIAWWKFDDGRGTTALDWSGHGNHGTLFGPKWAIPGLLGNAALNFDGTDYVAIQNLSYNSTDNTELTVCAWIRTSSGHNQSIASFDRDDYWRLEINGPGDHPGQVGWDVMTSSGQVDNNSNRRVDDGLWHHVTGVFDNGRLTIYIDGRPEASVYGGNTFGSGNTRFGFMGAYSEATSFNGSRYGSPITGDIDELRIYNKALTVEEIKLAMRGDPLVAWGPKPANGSTPYIRDTTPLSWSAGDMASGHDVYFGTDRDDVADASDATGIYRGRQGCNIYTPPEVEWGGGPYYWRIDEYNNDATISKGNVWRFTVTDYLTVDDFEDYNDYPPDEIWFTWVDGYEIPTNGSTLGYSDPDWWAGEHYVETTIVHGGGQSMPYFYDNNFKYSEATMTLVSARDWTEEGDGVLSLWLYGDAYNIAERMYVALNGSAVVYHDNPNAAQIDEWTEWTIDMQEFAAKAVNLANVDTISIGFGDKNNLQAGGSGMVLFDDIRLYRPAPPEPEPAPKISGGF